MKINIFTLTFCCVVSFSFSQSAGSYFRQGKKQKKEGKTDDAIVSFSKAIDIKPKYKFFLARAEESWQIGKKENAIADYKKCIEFSPSEINNYLDAADLFLDLLKWNEAAEILSYPVKEKK